MYLIVGLGNPGKQYEATRHNMGFDAIDYLIEKYNIPQAGVKFNAMYGKGVIGGEKVILMKPLSFMNLSGGPVQEMANYFKIDPETEMVVIYDDIDLEPGQIRIRKQGSAGGHNGIKDIIRRLGTEKFLRIKVGVGAEMANYFKIDPETEMVVIYDDIDLEPGQIRIRKQGSAGGHNGIKDIIRCLGTEKFLRIKVGVGAKPKGWDLADHVLSRFADSDRRLVDEAIENAGDAVEKILSQGPDGKKYFPRGRMQL